MFEIGAIWHASHFTRLLLNIAKYVQIKFSNNKQEGLHYLDLEKCKEAEMMITMMIRDNYKGHTKHEIRKAIETRKLP